MGKRVIAGAVREDGFPEPSSEKASSKAGLSDSLPPDSQTSRADDASGSRIAEDPASSTATVGAPLDAATALPQALKITGAVVAPSSLLTALMFYFGRQWANGFFRYFGVHFTVLDFTVQDYLIRSVDGLILPLIAAAGATLLALWIYQLPLEALPARTQRIALRLLMPPITIAGLALVSLALADVWSPVLPTTFPEGRGLSFSIGVLLLAYAARLMRLLAAQRRPGQVRRRVSAAVAVGQAGALFILVSVGLFWAVGDYANLVGMGRAQGVEASLPGYPDVVLYSEKSLSMQGPGVREIGCQYPEAAYRFRYETLKLVLQSGDQYLLLPSGWTHFNGAAIVLPRSQSLRLEFSPPGQVRNPTC
jgi:hypothetical protein